MESEAHSWQPRDRCRNPTLAGWRWCWSIMAAATPTPTPSSTLRRANWPGRAGIVSSRYRLPTWNWLRLRLTRLSSRLWQRAPRLSWWSCSSSLPAGTRRATFPPWPRARRRVIRGCGSSFQSLLEKTCDWSISRWYAPKKSSLAPRSLAGASVAAVCEGPEGSSLIRACLLWAYRRTGRAPEAGGAFFVAALDGVPSHRWGASRLHQDPSCSEPVASRVDVPY